jgi:trans-aconitate 2-methyltransferase
MIISGPELQMAENTPSHEFDAERYQQCSKHQKEWGNKVIDELHLNGNENVLDIGCGDGILTSRLADLVPNGYVLGIDASRSMIKAASKLRRDNLDFRLLSAEDIDMEGEFDLIFSNSALHWVLDHDKMLDDCKAALRKGGKLRFNFAGDGNCANFFEIVRQVMGAETFREYFSPNWWPWYMPTVQDYQALVSKKGFSKAKVWGENADRHFTREELIGWIEHPSIVPMLECISVKDKMAFRDRVVSLMLERTIEPSGTYFETFRRIHLEAGK